MAQLRAQNEDERLLRLFAFRLLLLKNPVDAGVEWRSDDSTVPIAEYQHRQPVGILNDPVERRAQCVKTCFF